MTLQTCAFEIEIEDFKPYERASLRGFLTVRIVELDLSISDLTVHEQNGKRWIGLPGKPQIDRDRKVITGADGKIVYVPILKFASRQAADAFRDSVLVAFDAWRRP